MNALELLESRRECSMRAGARVIWASEREISGVWDLCISTGAKGCPLLCLCVVLGDGQEIVDGRGNSKRTSEDVGSRPNMWDSDSEDPVWGEASEPEVCGRIPVAETEPSREHLALSCDCC